MLANIISNNSRMAGSYFSSTYYVQSILTYTNKYEIYLLALINLQILKKEYHAHIKV